VRKLLKVSVIWLLCIMLIPSVVVADDGSGSADGSIPQLSPAQPGTLLQCEELLSFDYPETVIESAELVAEGEVVHAGQPVGAHCLVQGKMHERVSPVDGQTYAIAFEMRLPVDWSGRFLYQANGGMDGSVVPAMGNFTGGQLKSGLQMGFAIISSDAGHHGGQNPLFGLDPQARLDYGYQAVGKLTPMAKKLIEAAYGREPDRSYIAGGSNGGRHTMVAAARYADLYDGFLAGAPGFNLPQAAMAQLWGAQLWATVATDTADLNTALTPAERQLVAQSILNRCDALDGLVDGLVQDYKRCQEMFDVERDVPTCVGDRNGSCLTAEQKQVIRKVYAGARTSSGDRIYTTFPYDPGIAAENWAFWKFLASTMLDPVAVGFVFTTPPQSPDMLQDVRGFALSFDVDGNAHRIYESTDLYTESSMEFMTPPNPTNLDTLRNRGAKMIVFHGASDGVFSSDDTARWWDELNAAYNYRADEFVRYFYIPGMAHVSGGPATDQFDGLGAIIDWVEYGKAPDRIIASARGEGNPGGVNPEVPADWAADRTRPLCPYPLVARYVGGDPEKAESFECLPSGAQPSLVKLSDLPDSPAAQLTDIAGHAASEDIALLVQKGVLKGYPDRTFRPDAPVTVAELLVVMSRVVDGFPANAPENVAVDPNYQWAKQAIHGGILAGVVTKGDVAALNQTVTRAHLADMLDRFGLLTGPMVLLYQANPDQPVTRAELATGLRLLLE
jgi:feruloyl esterase